MNPYDVQALRSGMLGGQGTSTGGQMVAGTQMPTSKPELTQVQPEAMKLEGFDPAGLAKGGKEGSDTGSSMGSSIMGNLFGGGAQDPNFVGPTKPGMVSSLRNYLIGKY